MPPLCQVTSALQSLRAEVTDASAIADAFSCNYVTLEGRDCQGTRPRICFVCAENTPRKHQVGDAPAVACERTLQSLRAEVTDAYAAAEAPNSEHVALKR
jgi:hypothetical protein